jgi:hypothetical protein
MILEKTQKTDGKGIAIGRRDGIIHLSNAGQLKQSESQDERERAKSESSPILNYDDSKGWETCRQEFHSGE